MAKLHAWQISLAEFFAPGTTVYLVEQRRADHPAPTGPPANAIATVTANARGGVDVLPAPFRKSGHRVPAQYAAIGLLPTGAWGRRLFFAYSLEDPNAPAYPPT